MQGGLREGKLSLSGVAPYRKFQNQIETEEMTMKKLFALILTLVMIFSLAACGGGDDKPSSTPKPPSSSQQQEQKTPDPDPVEDEPE